MCVLQKWWHCTNNPILCGAYLLYSLLTSPVQPDDGQVTKPKHVVVSPQFLWIEIISTFTNTVFFNSSHPVVLYQYSTLIIRQ